MEQIQRLLSPFWILDLSINSLMSSTPPTSNDLNVASLQNQETLEIQKKQNRVIDYCLIFVTMKIICKCIVYLFITFFIYLSLTTEDPRVTTVFL